MVKFLSDMLSLRCCRDIPIEMGHRRAGRGFWGEKNVLVGNFLWITVKTMGCSDEVTKAQCREGNSRGQGQSCGVQGA